MVCSCLKGAEPASIVGFYFNIGADPSCCILSLPVVLPVHDYVFDWKNPEIIWLKGQRAISVNIAEFTWWDHVMLLPSDSNRKHGMFHSVCMMVPQIIERCKQPQDYRICVDAVGETWRNHSMYDTSMMTTIFHSLMRTEIAISAEYSEFTNIFHR